MQKTDFMKIFDEVSLKKRGVILTANGELNHDGALAIKQNWEQYTKDDHEMWEFLYKMQFENLQDIAYLPWLEAIQKIGLQQAQLPKLTEIAQHLVKMTGWLPVPISGFLAPADYFSYIAKRQFPTVVSIRTKEKWEFIVEPDFFHDAFGHLPMHSHPVFADFLHLFGQVAHRAKTEQQIVELTRLYWFTVEYGLIKEGGQIKVCGSGHMSGYKEARYSLSDKVVKHPFVLEEVVNQDYNPHILQGVLFVLDSYDQLYEAMQRKAKEFGLV